MNVRCATQTATFDWWDKAVESSKGEEEKHEPIVNERESLNQMLAAAAGQDIDVNAGANAVPEKTHSTTESKWRRTDPNASELSSSCKSGDRSEPTGTVVEEDEEEEDDSDALSGARQNVGCDNTELAAEYLMTSPIDDDFREESPLTEMETVNNGAVRAAGCSTGIGWLDHMCCDGGGPG